MTCFRPIKAYRGDGGKVVFSSGGQEKGFIDRWMELPCGKCLGCKERKSKEWATRMAHELMMHRSSCFLTLTYNSTHLPEDLSLNRRHFADFIRSVRKRTKKKIRYYHCGEYGEINKRPHYHALLFGYRPDDLEHLPNVGSNGFQLYRSRFLEKSWGKGFVSVGTATWQSAAYVARYMIKKIGACTEDNIDEYLERYGRWDEHGEFWTVEPEYATMSLKPGIGAGYREKFKNELSLHDNVIVNGSRQRVPRYYDKLFAEEDPEGFAAVQKKRRDFAFEKLDDSTPERLRVREKVQKARLSLLKRDIV